ncbi:MAG: hypothetical protein QM634_14675, partial [Gordonia sp. (in: high G+C Gram-positive bacteria)]
MVSAQDLITALQQWAAGASADGLPVPANGELDAIAAAPGTWRQAATPIAQWWGPTIDHLLAQVDLGVLPTIAVAHLPAALAHPATPPPAGVADHRAPDPVAAPPDDQRPPDPATDLTAELIAWRGRKIAEGAPGAETIKDITLRNLAKRAPVTAEQIRKKLPGAAGLVDDLAAVFARFGAGSVPASATVAERTTAPAASSPPAAPA